MGIFENVKATVGMITAAEYCGLKVKQNGFINCPFHNDKHPSMKLYRDHYYCFTCGAHGDVISLTAQIFGLSQYEAALKLAADFGISIEGKPIHKPKPSNYISIKESQELLKEYIALLESMRDKYRPAAPDEEWHPMYIDSVRWLLLYQYYYDLLTFGNREEQKQFIKEARRLFHDLRTKLRHTRLFYVPSLLLRSCLPPFLHEKATAVTVTLFGNRLLKLLNQLYKSGNLYLHN